MTSSSRFDPHEALRQILPQMEDNFTQTVQTILKTVEYSFEKEIENQQLIERNSRLETLVRAYWYLVNTYHEDYPHPEDLADRKAELESQAKELLGE